MLRMGIVLLGITTLAWGQGFTFTLGSPVAAQDFQFKSAAFVFRAEGCPEPDKLQLSAIAEGVVSGERRSVTVKVMPASKPGVYAIAQSWPVEGKWVVILKGACGGQTAGALVPVGPRGFLREAAKVLPRPATSGEIEAALKIFTDGGKQ
ncbi:MAG: hypothetical protein ABI759_07030 [Candidatus Solibacter sp.]